MQGLYRPLARATLVLTLLSALISGWNAGLLHPFKHVDENGRLVHLAGAPVGDSQPASPATDKLCDVLAGLAACLPGATSVVAELAGTQFVACDFAGEPRAADAPPFLSQGPPTLL